MRNWIVIITLSNATKCGIKSITFINRPVTFVKKIDKFAWPNNFGEKGKIWTTQLSESEINRLLKYIDEVDESEWNAYINTIKSDIMEFDYEVLH